MNEISILEYYDRIGEVEHGIKPDGTLTAMCRYCCVYEVQHSFEVYSSNPNYDIINFKYSHDEGISHVLHWLEEKSEKV